MDEAPKFALKHVEKDKFDVKVFIHDQPNGTGSVPCWTFVTSGFMKLGQKEFVLTIRRKLNESEMAPPWEVLDMFRQFYVFAEQQQYVDVGGVSGFQVEESFFGLTGLVGFAYIQPQVLHGVDMPAPESCITAILLVPGEVEFASKIGTYRILSRLCKRSFYFPCPPWSDRSREPTITVDDWENSVVTKMPFTNLSRSYFRLPTRKNHVSNSPGELVETKLPGGAATLFIHPEDVKGFIALLQFSIDESATLIGMGLLPDPEAGMQLVWTPDMTGSTVNGISFSDSSGVTGGFVLLGFDEQLAENGCYAEDGIFFTLKTSQWLKIRAQLMQRKEVTLAPAGPGGLGLTVRFVGTANKPWWKIW